MPATLVYIVIGFIAATLIVAIYHRRRLETQMKIWGLALIIAALIYVAFNLFGAAWSVLPVELLGVVLYGGMAVLSWKHHPLWLAAGWLLHLGWDLGVHPMEGANYVPHWYPAACLGFDLAIAGYLFWLVVRPGDDD